LARVHGCGSDNLLAFFKMNILWAPWRMTYIRGEKQKDCLFCNAPHAGNDSAKFILLRSDHVFVMLNAFPYNNGHLLVSPYRHVPSLEDLADPLQLDLMRTLQRGLAALRAAFRPEGFNIGANLGRVAGAGIEAHLHFHIVPRWGGDTNFMTVIPEVRVLPQTLEETYKELLPHFHP